MTINAVVMATPYTKTSKNYKSTSPSALTTLLFRSILLRWQESYGVFPIHLFSCLGILWLFLLVYHPHSCWVHLRSRQLNAVLVEFQTMPDYNEMTHSSPLSLLIISNGAATRFVFDIDASQPYRNKNKPTADDWANRVIMWMVKQTKTCTNEIFPFFYTSIVG